jgi:L-fuconolactonase
MLIVDAQVHIWAAHTPERPWPEYGFGKEHRPVPLSAKQLVADMDEAGVNRTVLVPPSWEGEYNDLAIAAAQDYPGRFAIMGRFEIGDRANEARMAGWKSQPGMLGIRVTFLRKEQQDWLKDGSIDWFWAKAEELDIPVMVLPPGQIPQIDSVAARHPGLRLVIDHLAMSRETADPFSTVKDVLALARHSNVAVKTTCLPGYTAEPYPFAGIRHHVEAVFDHFGPDRMFWGTDLTRLPCTYRQAVTHFTDELPFLKGRDLERVMGTGICDWLGWAY